jgi:putative hydrolase of the HAD superfamily
VAHLEACLIDAYGTILHADFTTHRNEIPAMAGISANAMYGEFGRLAPVLGTGQISMTEAFARILRASGVEPKPDLVRELVDKRRELLLSLGRLYDDVLATLRKLRSRGIKTAIVSNCDEDTRELLAELGVAALVDALVLSCEVGAEKPAPQIYQHALDQLGVTAGAALFVDDTAAYCAGAAALGIRAVQIVRGETDGNVPAGTPVVRSLAEVEAMFF